MSALPVFLLLCLAATGLCEPPHKRIINGNDAEPGSHPYFGLVISSINGNHSLCGGTLISRDWVLTAAHCLYYNGVKIRSNNIKVLMGPVNRTDTSNVNTQILRANDTIIHPGYKDGEELLFNDIALINLLTPATLNKNVKIASLAKKEDDFLGEKCVLAGWGRNSTGQHPERLQEVEIGVISMPVCKTLLFRSLKERMKEHLKSFFKNGTLLPDLFCNENFAMDLSMVTEKQICVHDATLPEGSRPGACSGDSGGPMMCGSGHNVLAGVTSWTVMQRLGCNANYPSIYTRVSAYRDWIDQYVSV